MTRLWHSPPPPATPQPAVRQPSTNGEQPARETCRKPYDCPGGWGTPTGGGVGQATAPLPPPACPLRAAPAQLCPRPEVSTPAHELDLCPGGERRTSTKLLYPQVTALRGDELPHLATVQSA